MNKTARSFILGIILSTVVLVIAISVKNKNQSSTTEDTGNVEVNHDEEIDENGDIIVEVDEGEIAIGNPAPDFTLKDLDGKQVSLSDYHGKIVLINFWATWCKFCDVEMPDLDDIDKENDDLVILAVDVMEEEGKVKKYIEDGGYDFDVVLDSDGEISRQYLVSAYPTTYAVDEKGILVGSVPGMMTKPQMEQIVESVRGEE